LTKFDECIIHIGTAKTGTKTLQEFFYKNKSNLLKEDIFYPETFGKRNHTRLSAYASADHKKGDIRLGLGLTNLELIKEFRKKIDTSFRKEIKKQNCTKLLLSGEHMQIKLKSIEEIQFLKKFLDNFVNKYKIVVYLRSQLEMAISDYSTRCRAGGTEKIILHNVKENSSYYNHEKLLDRWSNVFGCENIIPKIFSKTEFPDGDIKKDFIRTLGLNWKNFIDVENVNESLNSDAQRFLLEINKFLPKFIDDKKNKERGDLVKLVSYNRIGKGLLPTHQEAENCYKNFIDSNERLRKKWFPNRKNLFEVDLSKYPETSLVNSDFTFAFKIFAEIWSKKHAQVDSLLEKKIGKLFFVKNEVNRDLLKKFLLKKI